MKFLPLLTVALFSACAGPNKAYRISPEFTEAESIAIRSQAQKWTDPGLDRITLSDDADGIIELTDNCHDGACVGVIEYEIGDDGTRIRLLNQRGRPDWLEYLAKDALHEFGHALAGRLNNHHLPAGNVMAPTIDTQPEYPTALDFAFARGEML